MEAVSIALINNLPSILSAFAAFAAALFALRNGKKTDEVGAKADAAVAASAEVQQTALTIANQTNGHLSRLTDDLARLTIINDGLRATVITLTGVLNARQVRRTDLVPTVMDG